MVYFLTKMHFEYRDMKCSCYQFPWKTQNKLLVGLIMSFSVPRCLFKFVWKYNGATLNIFESNAILSAGLHLISSCRMTEWNADHKINWMCTGVINIAQVECQFLWFNSVYSLGLAICSRNVLTYPDKSTNVASLLSLLSFFIVFLRKENQFSVYHRVDGSSDSV